MTIYNASGITCQLGNFCFECMTPYTHFSAFKYSEYSYCWRWEWEWEGMGIVMSGKWNENEVLDWEWELDGNWNDFMGI